MKTSIRTKFSFGIVFFFVIIAILFVFSTLKLTSLSKKTGAILKENHVSVVCAREMSDALTNINQEITRSFIQNKNANSTSITDMLSAFEKSLQLEKNNITEVGEDKLVSTIESGYNQYRDSTSSFLKMPKSIEMINYLQQKFIDVNQQLMILSQMNGKAIELKTNDAKIYANKAWIQMAVLGTFCFLIALSFTYSFASYFNERFFQLHTGIKEIVSSNYGQRLHFEGKDEFYEIALVFNEMAEKLNEKKQKQPIVLMDKVDKEINAQDIEELKRMLEQMKIIEEQANRLISKYDTPA
jgi:two-component system, NtrC family, sensor histidine kinase KinB